MDTPQLTRQQSRELDRRAQDDYGISGLVLMENAGRGTVDVLERLGIGGPVVILCGKGNNAGDGFVIARHLEIRGHACRVLLLCPPHELRGDAATNFAISRKSDVPIVELASAGDVSALRSALDQHGAGAAWLVDAMLGTGVEGEPRPPFDTAIDWINVREAKTQAMAVDVPSGLDCDTGRPAAHTIRADHTCTFAAMKIGYTQPGAAAYTGQVHVCDIGTPPRLLREVSSV
jgi:NAD(P)H-hydrate epimerase